MNLKYWSSNFSLLSLRKVTVGLGDIRFFFVLFFRGESLHSWAESSKVNSIDVALGTFGYRGLSLGPLPTGWYGHLVPNDPETEAVS